MCRCYCLRGLSHRIRGRCLRRFRAFLQALRHPDSWHPKAWTPGRWTAGLANWRACPVRHPDLPRLPPTGCRSSPNPLTLARNLSQLWKGHTCRLRAMDLVFESCVSPVVLQISRALQNKSRPMTACSKLPRIRVWYSRQAPRLCVRQFVQCVVAAAFQYAQRANRKRCFDRLCLIRYIGLLLF